MARNRLTAAILVGSLILVTAMLAILFRSGTVRTNPMAGVQLAYWIAFAGFFFDRPVAVVAMPSRTRPLLVGSLARRLAEVGRLPLGSLAYTDGGPPDGSGGGNSAFRLAAVWNRLVVPPELASGLAALDEAPVLLIDDLTDSRWTLTVAARTLRRAGAGGVLPFVLGLAG